MTDAQRWATLLIKSEREADETYAEIERLRNKLRELRQEAENAENYILDRVEGDGIVLISDNKFVVALTTGDPEIREVRILNVVSGNNSETDTEGESS